MIKTNMEKTANITVVQNTVNKKLHKRAQHNKVIERNTGCSRIRKLSGRKNYTILFF